MRVSEVPSWGVTSLVQTDQAESLAGRVSFFEALRHGTFQRWDPNLAAGEPSGTLPLGSLFSPFFGIVVAGCSSRRSGYARLSMNKVAYLLR